ncbi:MAG TPA: hypothetical protein VN229_20335 [Terriglobales bacterium]|nr:hypothetical protein [Terriglobales bacterium]
MDWIERWFGFAPDNGDGTLELVIMATGLGLIVIAVIWKVPRWRAAVFRLMTGLRHGDHQHREH